MNSEILCKCELHIHSQNSDEHYSGKYLTVLEDDCTKNTNV